MEQGVAPYPFWMDDEASGSFVIEVASNSFNIIFLSSCIIAFKVRIFFLFCLGGIWNMLRKGVGIPPPLDELHESLKTHSLANQSLYLLLVLVYHCAPGPAHEPDQNIYRIALAEITNEQPNESGL